MNAKVKKKGFYVAIIAYLLGTYVMYVPTPLEILKA